MEAIYLGIYLNDVHIPTIQNLINGKPMYKIDCLAGNLVIKKID
ncbi:hypothetical protein ACFOWM_01565 [Ferruginibacter yonginensis]|uniref:Uncharacterized protein n=1 Tax=Ferruginibacter yonginensis TaxID=1310416 RepID=A0ABV8QQ71_9BACT